MNSLSSNLPTPQNSAILEVEGPETKNIYQVQITGDDGTPSDRPDDLRWYWYWRQVVEFINRRSVGITTPTNFIVEIVNVE